MDITSVTNIRKTFGEADAKRDEGLKTPSSLQRHDNIPYGVHGEWNLLDIYTTKDIHQDQPTIISIHGGGWVYGSKDIYQFYCMELATKGFTVVNFNYRLAPENPFPAAIIDINEVFTWITHHASEYSIDLNNLFIVGDSAGAHLASLYTALLTNTEFQSLYSCIVPSDKIKIKAVALNCGIYDIHRVMKKEMNGPFMAFIGEDSNSKIPLLDTTSYITPNYPPSYIMTSYYDFLKEEAKPMYNTLKAQGIPCEYILYGDDSRQDLAHVFHLNIRTEDARLCNDTECNFFKKYLS